MTHGRKENKCGGRSGINWKLANRECVTSLTHAYPSEDFEEIFRTRLENKVGTMTEKRVLATVSKRHLNSGTPNLREGLVKMDPRGPHLRRRKVCIGPTRLAPSFSHCHLLLLPLLRFAKSPHLVGRCTCEAHACLPFSPFKFRGPACRSDQKDCLTIRRGSNIALEDTLVLCSTGRGSLLLLSGHFSTTPDLTPFGTPFAAAISFARPATFSHDAHDFA